LSRNRDIFPRDFRPVYFGKQIMVAEDLRGFEFAIDGYRGINYEMMERSTASLNDGHLPMVKIKVDLK